MWASRVLTSSRPCRYCIDNGAMISQAGVCAFLQGFRTPVAEATCTQRFGSGWSGRSWGRDRRGLGWRGMTGVDSLARRFRTDEVFVDWREDGAGAGEAAAEGAGEGDADGSGAGEAGAGGAAAIVGFGDSSSP